MVILGISALDNDTTTSVLVDGDVASVVMEERLTRRKHQNGFPQRGLDLALQIAGVRLEDVTAVAYPFFSWAHEGYLMATGFLTSWPAHLRHARASYLSRLLHQAFYARWVVATTRNHWRYQRELMGELAARGLAHKLHRVEHHLAHAAGGFAWSGFDRALVFTLDWYGSGCAGSVSVADHRGVTMVKRFIYPNSLGLFYANVTEALGYIPCHHEGKIVGLAAYGAPRKLFEDVYSRFRCEDGDLHFFNGMDRDWVRQLSAANLKEDVAAAHQAVLEQLASDLVGHYVGKYAISDVVLAGGVAANVKMNQRIYETPGVRRVFVYPDMGDGGTGLGAAVEVHRRLTGQALPTSRRFKDLYRGPTSTDAEVAAAIQRHGLPFSRPVDMADAIADLLAKGLVVGRFTGAMEFGPRALGHRSVLSQAVDPEINATLNHRLGRTEFMPFAPATLVEHASARYENVHGAADTARFMTITFNCTERMKRESPAAVHVDGTARPQLVDAATAPDFNAILAAYHRRTGIPTLINTSFNMHEEPIVCAADDGVAAFLAGRVDALAIGSVLVHHPSRTVQSGESGLSHRSAAAPSRRAAPDMPAIGATATPPRLSELEEAHRLGLAWLRDSGIRKATGALWSKYDYKIKEYSSWSPGAGSCLMCTAGATRLFLEEGWIDLAVAGAQHILSLRVPPESGLGGALLSGTRATVVTSNYAFYAVDALLDVGLATGQSRFLDAAQAAGESIVRYAQGRDGGICDYIHLHPTTRRLVLLFGDRSSWNVVGVAPLLRLAEQVADDRAARRFADAAGQLLAWWKRLMRPDGWVPLSQVSLGMRGFRRLRQLGRSASTSQAASPSIHPAGIGWGARALLMSGEPDLARRCFGWLASGLTPRGLLRQWYHPDASPASPEEDTMPTALLALLALAAPMPDGDRVVMQIARGLLEAQERGTGQPDVDGGFYGLPGDTRVAPTVLFAWDTVFATLTLGRLTRRLRAGLSPSPRVLPSPGLDADPLRVQSVPSVTHRPNLRITRT
jgi:carbamoyltransferase